MKNKKEILNRIGIGFGKFMSNIVITKNVIILLGIVLLVLLMASIITCCMGSNYLGRFVADMVYDGSFKDYLYDIEDHNGFGTVIATVVGEFILSGLILATIIGYFRSAGERYVNGQNRKYYWGKHSLFLGYDERMIGTLKKAREENKVVIAVPNKVKELRDVLKRILSDTELKGVECVQCRRDDVNDLLTKACVLDASEIYIIGQPDEQNHDALNFKSLAIIANECKKRNVESPHIIAYLQNQSSFSMLKTKNLDCESLKELLPDKEEKDKLLDNEFLNSNCELFNFYSDTAFRLLTDVNGMKLDWHSDDKNLLRCPERQVHLVVVGMTEMGVAIVREALKLAHPTGKNTRFKITMVDDNAYEEMHYFIGRTKELFDYCNYTYQDYDNPSLNFSYKPENDFLDVEFEFVKCDAAHPKLMKNLVEWATDGKQLLSLVVCTKKSSQNMAVALYLPRQLRVGEYAIPVWVYQEGDDSMKHLMDSDNYNNLHTFSVGDHPILTVLRNETDIYIRVKKLALAYEEAYSNQKPDWTKMPAIKRWSSIYTVFSMDIKMRAVSVDLSDADKDIIDRTEQNRWNVEKLSDGYIPTTKEQHAEIQQILDNILKNNPDWQNKNEMEKKIIFDEYEKKMGVFKAQKNHDNIRSYDDLDEYAKNKNRFILEKSIEMAQVQ